MLVTNTHLLLGAQHNLGLMKFRILMIGLSLLVLIAIAAYWLAKAHEQPSDPHRIQIQRDNLRIG